VSNLWLANRIALVRGCGQMDKNAATTFITLLPSHWPQLSVGNDASEVQFVFVKWPESGLVGEKLNQIEWKETSD